MGPRNAIKGGGDACEDHHWRFRRSSLWGHETLCWVQETHAKTATGALGGRWSSLWGHETLCWVGETHANTATRATAARDILRTLNLISCVLCISFRLWPFFCASHMP